MSIKFTGDFKKLKHWEDLTERAPELMATISKNLADESISLARDSMNRGVDPYGKRYPPLVLRSGQPLKKTGGMMAAWNRQHANRGSFKISNAKNYSGFHQQGTGIYGPRKQRIEPKTAKALRVPTPGGAAFFSSVKGTPKRRMVPDRGVLPRAWKLAYQKTTNEIFLSHFSSRR